MSHPYLTRALWAGIAPYGPTRTRPLALHRPLATVSLCLTRPSRMEQLTAMATRIIQVNDSYGTEEEQEYGGRRLMSTGGQPPAVTARQVRNFGS